MLNDPNVSDAWSWFADTDSVRAAVAGIPEMERAFAVDPAGARAFIEVAMVVRSAACVEHNHMVSLIANPLRHKKYMRSRCLHVS